MVKLRSLGKETRIEKLAIKRGKLTAASSPTNRASFIRANSSQAVAYVHAIPACVPSTEHDKLSLTMTKSEMSIRRKDFANHNTTRVNALPALNQSSLHISCRLKYRK